MASEHPVVVYGASGYTGKLVSESLAQRGIPFIAAGRDQKRLEEELAKVAGADAVARAVPHTYEALVELLADAKVVVNVAGPFAQLAKPVIQAALETDTHYFDTTGEQDFVIATKAEFGDAFKKKDLVLCPACAYMWTAGLQAAEICLETKGIDSLDILYFGWGGNVTIASTKSFLRMNCREHYHLENNEYVAWPSATSHKVITPDSHHVYPALSWAGGCEPVWYHDDDRVRNCRVLVGSRSQEWADTLVGYMKEYNEKAKTMSDDELEEMTNAWGANMSSTPPRETPETSRYTVSCRGRGVLVQTECVLTGTSPYIQTGFLTAEGAQRVLDGRIKKFGFVSPTEAMGAREIINALADAGLQCPV